MKRCPKTGAGGSWSDSSVDTMEEMNVIHQALVFGSFMALGILLAFLFHIITAWKEVIYPSRRTLFFVDLLCFVLAAFSVCGLLFVLYQGEVRFFVFGALLGGLFIYRALIGPQLNGFLKRFFRVWRKIVGRVIKFIGNWKEFGRQHRIRFIKRLNNLLKFTWKGSPNGQKKERKGN